MTSRRVSTPACVAMLATCTACCAVAGALVPTLAQWLGGGLVRTMLAGAALLLAARCLLQWLDRLRYDRASVLVVAAAAPMVGAGLGRCVFQYVPASATTWRWLADLNLPHDARGASAAGAALCTALAIFFSRHDSASAGALVGAAVGALIGLIGDWGSSRWFMGIVSTALLLLIVVRLCLHIAIFRACDEGKGFRRLLDAAALLVVGTLLGCVLVGGGLWLARWIGGQTVWEWVVDAGVFIASLFGYACELVGFEGNWLNGAFASLLVLVYFAGLFVAEMQMSGSSRDAVTGSRMPPIELLVGAALGLADGLLGGEILGPALDTWPCAAISGALVGSVVFTIRDFADDYNSSRGPAGVVLAPSAVLGCGALVWLVGPGGTVARWLPAAAPAWAWPAACGAAAGVIFYFAWLETADDSLRPVRNFEPGRELFARRALALTATVALLVFFPWAVRTVKGVGHFADGMILFKSHSLAEAESQLNAAERFGCRARWLYRFRGNCAGLLDHHRQAISDFSRLIDLSATKADRGEYLAHRGVQYLDIDEPIRAVADLTAALALQPESLDALLGRVKAFRKLALYERARGDLDKALKLDTDTNRARYEEGLWYYDQKNDKQAVEAFTAALERDENDPIVLGARGWSRERQGEFDQALADFQRAIDLGDRDANSYSGRGWAHYGRKDYASAIDDFTRAITVGPANANPYKGRGRCRTEREEYDLALADFNEALRLEPNDAATLYDRSRLHQKLGNQFAADVDRMLGNQASAESDLEVIITSEQVRQAMEVGDDAAAAKRLQELVGPK